MYSKNTGNSGQDLQLFSGQGFKCNGTNQCMSAGTFSALGVSGDKSVLTIACTTSVATSGVLWNTGYSSGYAGVSLQVAGRLISLNSNSTENALLSTPYVAGQVVCTFNNNIWSIYINGILKTSRLFVYSTPFSLSASQVFSIGAYRLTAQYYNGIITDVYMFTDVLTADEIALYSANPNQFFQNVQDGIIDNCVLNMPLHGVDEYQVDYSRFSLGLVNADVNLTNSIPLASNTITKVGNVFTIVDTVAEEFSYEPNVRFYPLIYDTSLYTVKIKVKCISGTAYIKSFEGTPQIILNKVLTAGQEYTYESATRFSNIGGQRGSLTFDGLNYTNFTVEVTVKVYKVVAGVNEVINYTADCVTSAKQLPYGSQEANFFHKSNGVPTRTGLSPFFESTPYWNNYGNTGWVPKVTDTFIFEFIFNITADNEFRLCGNTYVDGVYFGKNSGGKKIYARIFGTPVLTVTAVKDYILITCKYNPDTKTAFIYLDGVLISTQISALTTASMLPVILGLVNVTGTYKVNTPIRHFKVITDAKTINNYDALVEYNKLVQKGLLANFLLDENGNYIKDESNNYIMDI